MAGPKWLAKPTWSDNDVPSAHTEKYGSPDSGRSGAARPDCVRYLPERNIWMSDSGNDERGMGARRSPDERRALYALCIPGCTSQLRRERERESGQLTGQRARPLTARGGAPRQIERGTVKLRGGGRRGATVEEEEDPS